MDECVGHTPSVQSSLGDTGVRVNFYIGWGGGGGAVNFLFSNHSAFHSAYTHIYIPAHMWRPRKEEREKSKGRKEKGARGWSE